MTKEALSANKFCDQVVDARDLRCPMPLLRAKQALRTMSPGQCLKVMATDSGSVRDFQSFAQISGNRLEASTEEEGVYTYILVKCDPANGNSTVE